MIWDGRLQRCSIKTGETGPDDGSNESDRTHAQVRNKMPGTSPLSRWRMSNRLKSRERSTTRGGYATLNRSQSVSRTLASTDLDVRPGRHVENGSVFSRTSFIFTGPSRECHPSA